ncbi:unnamed protein product [Withania somnifera]
MNDVSSTSNKLDEPGALALLGKIMVGVVIFLALVVVFRYFLHLYTKWFLNRWRAGRKVNANGLDPLILETIPMLAFDATEFKDGTLECTICLCEFSKGEKMRYLPKCNHRFHVDCIDMWFQSHTTCPLCRNAVSKIGELPSETMEEALLLLRLKEESKSVMPERLRHLMWLLCGDKGVFSPSSSRNVGIEQER